VVDDESSSVTAVDEACQTNDGYSDIATFAVDESDTSDEDGRYSCSWTDHTHIHRSVWK